MGDVGEQSRQSAEIFGQKVEEALGNLGEAADALNGKRSDQQGEPPATEEGTTININVGS